MPDPGLDISGSQLLCILMFAVVGGLLLGRIHKPLVFIGVLIVVVVAFGLTVMHV